MRRKPTLREDGLDIEERDQFFAVMRGLDG